MASEKYAGIIGLPHHVSEKHPRMDKLARAAQFSPFAALTGFDSYIVEEGRFTNSKVELDDAEKAELDRALRALSSSDGKTAEITYYLADSSKAGGSYVTVTASVGKIDAAAGTVLLSTGETVSVTDIVSVVPFGEGW